MCLGGFLADCLADVLRDRRSLSVTLYVLHCREFTVLGNDVARAVAGEGECERFLDLMVAVACVGAVVVLNMVRVLRIALTASTLTRGRAGRVVGLSDLEIERVDLEEGVIVACEPYREGAAEEVLLAHRSIDGAIAALLAERPERRCDVEATGPALNLGGTAGVRSSGRLLTDLVRDITGTEGRVLLLLNGVRTVEGLSVRRLAEQLAGDSSYRVIILSNDERVRFDGTRLESRIAQRRDLREVL